MNRQRRRAALTLLALPAIGATGVMRGFAVAAASDGDGPRRIELPRFSAAPPGQRLPAGWTHQTLPSVERPNRFDLVVDEGVTVLRVLSDHSASSLAVVQRVDPAATPLLRWRWRVSNTRRRFGSAAQGRR